MGASRQRTPTHLGALVAAGLTLAGPGCTALIGLDKNYGQADASADAPAPPPPDAPADAPPDNACGANRLICNGSCIDVSADPMNCGQCGRTCGQGFACAASRCEDEVARVAAGGEHACVVLRGGKVYCWGNNARSAVGASAMGNQTCGATPCRTAPTDTGLTDVAEVALASQAACARKTDGSVFCWGSNAQGQLGHAPGTNGDAACGASQCNAVPKQVMGVTAQQLGAGAQHFCALTTTGAVYCWGVNSDGQLGRGSLSASSSSPAIVPTLSGNVVALAGGLAAHSCAVKGDGTVWCWGLNTRGALGHNPGGSGDVLDAGMAWCNPTPAQVGGMLTGVDAASTGSGVSCAHKTGTGWLCWGNQGHGALGTGGASDTSNHATPAAVSVVPGGAVLLATGWETPCATDTSGKLFCWGRNDWGAIGNGTFTGSSCESGVPCHTDAVAALAGAAELAATGGEMAVVKKPDGTVWAWGANADARLGHAPGASGDLAMCASGTTTCNPSPTQVMVP